MVVDVFDEWRKLSCYVTVGREGHRIYSFDLDSFHEALGLGIVARISSLAHRADDAILGQDFSVRGSCILRSGCRMRLGVGSQLVMAVLGAAMARPHISGLPNSMADNLTRPSIQGDGDLSKSGVHGDVSEIINPELVRAAQHDRLRHARKDR